jgi:hypothetical protein
MDFLRFLQLELLLQVWQKKIQPYELKKWLEILSYGLLLHTSVYSGVGCQVVIK